ncbi:MAG: pyridoxamine 5'-phosphate oxidase family protein [Methanoregulaceae archaeon]
MRRREKEIRDTAQVEAVLQAAEVLRVAFCDEGQPYLVPVSFGYEPGRLYFHSACEGRKMDILKKNPRCCFETEIGVEAIRTGKPCRWGMRYQSVIGEGTAHIVSDPAEKRRGLALIVRHYSGDPAGIPDAALETVAVVRIAIARMTGKTG